MKRMFSLKERVHGSDAPITFQWQNILGNYLATTGQDHTVKIWDRHGQLQEEIHLPGSSTGMEWDKDGDVLCAICEKSNMLFMWDANQKKVVKIDSGAKDGLTFLCWSKTTLHLAIGTAKGNLILYDHKVGRKVSVLGKHNKKIVSGIWSLQNKLALSGADNSVTVSDETGKTIHQFSVRDLPTRIRFSEIKRAGKNESGDNTVSAIVGKKTLFLYKLFDVENVIELAFQPNYGKIEAYEWYGNGYIMIGFSNGYIIAISTFAKEIGQELFQLRDHHDYLSSIAISTSLNYAASCGDTSVRIHDLHNVTEVSAILNLEDEPKGLKSIDWTTDGQLLAVSSARGNLHCYLTKLPILGDAFGTKLAYLTSLLEVTVVNNVEDEPATAVSIDIEPTFVACGPYHLAVGMNNRAWFYFLSDKETPKTCDKEYLESIKSMCLNADYAAVLFGGKVQLHMIDQRMHSAIEERETKLFPEREDMGKAVCCALTNDFLLFGTDTGNLYFFYIEDWAQVNVFRHSVGIRSIYPDSCGSFVAFIDEKGDGFIYNPVNDSTFEIPSIPSNSNGLLWEHNLYDKGVFVVFHDANINTYIFNRESTQGSHVALVGSTHLPINQKPLLLYNGTVTLQIASGKTTTMLLDTHSFLHVPDHGEEIVINRKKLEQAISLRRWREAWTICSALKTSSKQNWFRLGAAALHALEVDLAVRVYRYLGDAGMVLALEKLRDVEDSNLLAGTLASYMGEFDLAQDLLLRSSNPLAALGMRRDLMHWDTALQLANSLDVEQIPFIAKEYAQQLEFTGNYTSALSHFEKGVTRKIDHKEHDEACAAGVARTSIRLGDIRRGVQLALQHPSRQLKKECGSILEGMRQFQESASLFEKGEYFDKAAAVYIKCKNWQKVGNLLSKITSLKIFLQYAKAKEVDGKFTEAADAYHRGRDYDSEVRIYLDHLRDPERAVHVVKEQGSIEGAKMVAKFFIKHGDYGSAIQFLVLSKCNDEAFQMAQQHAQMEIYADIIGEDATAEDFRSIAVHFENDKNHLLAGKFFAKCGDYPKALRHYLKCSSSDMNEALLLAVEAVAAAKDNKLTRQLIDFIMGETDGVPRDPNYLFKLYMALGQFGDAAQTAVIISKDEQNNGNYRLAHKLLFSMLRELKDRKIKVPAEMESNLLILHSYILVKDHVKRGNHLIAARMLIRVAENISKFPQHIVPILTTTVIECRRGNLMRSSFSYAAMLMRPEYRNKIDPKFKKKIEDIVRKTGSNQEEEDERTTPCPYCGSELTETDLMCPGCRNTIPYCIATGRHVTRDNLTCCPRCQFPALSSELQRYLDFESSCPMCGEQVTSDELVRIRNPEKIFGDIGV